MSLPAQIRYKEDSAKELLLILANLLSNNLIEEDRFVELGLNVLRATSGEVLEITNQSVRSQHLPQAETTLTVALLLERIEADLAVEASDILDHPEEAESVKTRIGQTAWFSAWATYGLAVKRIGELSGKLIAWIVVPDERTCEICLQNEAGGPYEPSKLPVYPAHCFCRCWLMLVA